MRRHDLTLEINLRASANRHPRARAHMRVVWIKGGSVPDYVLSLARADPIPGRRPRPASARSAWNCSPSTPPASWPSDGIPRGLIVSASTFPWAGISRASFANTPDSDHSHLGSRP